MVLTGPVDWHLSLCGCDVMRVACAYSCCHAPSIVISRHLSVCIAFLDT